MPRRRRQQERQKSNRLNRQNNNSASAARFLIHFCADTRQLRHENASFHVLWCRRINDNENFFLFLNSDMVLRNSAPKEFSCVLKSERVGIIVIEIQRTRVR